MTRNRKKIYSDRRHFLLKKDNNEKIKELANILKISENKIINKIIEILNPLKFISEVKNENKINWFSISNENQKFIIFGWFGLFDIYGNSY